MTSQEFSVDWVVVGRKPVAAGQVAVDDSLEQRLLPEQVERRRAIRQQTLVDRAPGGNGPDFRTEGILFVLGGSHTFVSARLLGVAGFLEDLLDEGLYLLGFRRRVAGPEIVHEAKLQVQDEFWSCGEGLVVGARWRVVS